MKNVVEIFFLWKNCLLLKSCFSTLSCFLDFFFLSGKNDFFHLPAFKALPQNWARAATHLIIFVLTQSNCCFKYILFAKLCGSYVMTTLIALTVYGKGI